MIYSKIFIYFIYILKGYRPCRRPQRQDWGEIIVSHMWSPFHIFRGKKSCPGAICFWPKKKWRFLGCRALQPWFSGYEGAALVEKGFKKRMTVWDHVAHFWNCSTLLDFQQSNSEDAQIHFWAGCFFALKSMMFPKKFPCRFSTHHAGAGDDFKW